MVIVRICIDSQWVFYCKPCQNDTLLFNCFSICSSVHLWSQLKEAEQLLRDQRDLGTDESERSHWPYLSVFHGKPLVWQPSWLSRSFSFGWKYIFRQLDCANQTRINICHCFLIYLFLTRLTGLDFKSWTSKSPYFSVVEQYLPLSPFVLLE